MQTYELTGDSVQQTHIPVPRASYHYLCRDFQFSILEKVVILKQEIYDYAGEVIRSQSIKETSDKGREKLM